MAAAKRWVTANGNNIYLVLGRRCNCFLISKDTRYILIDTSWQSEYKTLEKRIRAIIGTGRLEAIVLTHTHFDHAANAARLKEVFQARIIVHRDEAGFLEEGSSPLPQGTILFTRTLLRLVNLHDTSFKRFEPVEADVTFEDQFDLDQFGLNARIIHTPGHTLGSCSVIIDDEIALVGDAMVGMFRGLIFPPFADDSELLINSWTRLLKTGCSLFLPAHGRGNSRSTVQKNHDNYRKNRPPE